MVERKQQDRRWCGRAMRCAAGLMLLLPGVAGAAVTIRDVRLIDYRIARTHAFVTSKGQSNACYGIFVLLQAEDSAGKKYTALGDVLPRGTVTNETLADAWTASNAFAAMVKGQALPATDLAADVTAARKLLDQLDQAAAATKLTTKKPPTPDKQLRATLCGFDIALVDLIGQIHGVPGYEVLGGAKRKNVTVSAMTFNADDSLDALADEVDQASDSYGAMRVKIGLDDEKDVAKIGAVAAQLKQKNSTADIWVDVNQAWKTADKSLEMLGRIRGALRSAGFHATFICEQPTIETDLSALAKVTAGVHQWRTDAGPATAATTGPTALPFNVVIMADEAVWTLTEAKKFVELNAGDYVNIKIQKAGGLFASMDIGQYLAEKSPNTGIYVGGLVSTDVNAWANLQLCMALPRLDLATGCIPRRAYPVNVAAVPLQYETGKTLKAPTAAGLGTGLDLKKLEPYVKRDTTDVSSH